MRIAYINRRGNLSPQYEIFIICLLSRDGILTRRTLKARKDRKRNVRRKPQTLHLKGGRDRIYFRLSNFPGNARFPSGKGTSEIG